MTTISSIKHGHDILSVTHKVIKCKTDPFPKENTHIYLLTILSTWQYWT